MKTQKSTTQSNDTTPSVVTTPEDKKPDLTTSQIIILSIN